MRQLDTGATEKEQENTERLGAIEPRENTHHLGRSRQVVHGFTDLFSARSFRLSSPPVPSPFRRF